MQVNTTQPVTQTSDYLQLTPVMHAMKTSNDKMPKNTLPTNTEGTIQENNSHLLPPVTLYNSHGILKKTNPNSLIGYA
jgi:hypothetical protein